MKQHDSIESRFTVNEKTKTSLENLRVATEQFAEQERAFSKMQEERIRKTAKKKRRQQTRNAIKFIVVYLLGILSSVIAQWVIGKLNL